LHSSIEKESPSPTGLGAGKELAGTKNTFTNLGKGWKLSSKRREGKFGYGWKWRRPLSEEKKTVDASTGIDETKWAKTWRRGLKVPGVTISKRGKTGN